MYSFHRGSHPNYGCAVQHSAALGTALVMPNLKPIANQRKAPRRRILKSGTIILGKNASPILGPQFIGSRCMS